MQLFFFETTSVAVQPNRAGCLSVLFTTMAVSMSLLLRVASVTREADNLHLGVLAKQ